LHRKPIILAIGFAFLTALWPSGMSDPHFSHTKPRLSVNVEAAA
jgi:hypothetical protein